MEGGFPRYVWCRNASSVLFEGRLTNSTLGEYKGYPIAEAEAPLNLKIANV
jgi:hypothetical protein